MMTRSQLHSERLKPKKNQSIWRRITKIVALVLLIVLIASAAFAGYLYTKAQATITSAQDPNRTQIHVSANDLSGKTALTTLVIGTATVKNENLATTIVIAGVNAKQQTMTLLSVDADTYLQDKQTTLAQYYASAGLQATIDELSTLFNVKISKYVLADMNGLGDFAQAAGGIVVENDTHFIAKGWEFPTGSVLLKTAKQVNAFTTYLDNDSEEGYLTRQQAVGMELLTQVKKPATLLLHTSGLLGALGKHVKTNVSFADSQKILLNYHNALKTQKKIHVHNSDLTLYDGTTVSIIPDQEQKQSAQTFAKALQ
ncbi:MAG TPA: LCP family protein [Lactobacillaceae bacterium]|jgi:anionic cell wall polymer biosynthesis LytR-Cps2A-Psr (LCP) family protein